jgi:hypothetical protein
MSADEGRVKPFETENAGRLGQAALHAENFLLKAGDELASLVAAFARITDDLKVVPNFIDGVRRERYHFRRMNETREDRAQIVWRCRANMAEILRNDDVGLDGAEPLCVKPVEAYPLGGKIVDLAIDLFLG